MNNNTRYNLPCMKLFIYEMRSKKGWSGVALAKKSGIPQASIYRYERGEESPTLERLEQIARALDVKMTDLFDSKYK